MTIDQAVNRQADHENLIRELVNALGDALEHLQWIGWGDRYERECAHDSGLMNKVDAVLAKAKEQGYA